MLVASKIGVDFNCIGFYLAVEEMQGVIVRYAYDNTQVGMLKYCFATDDNGYCYFRGLGGWILIDTNMCN